MNILIDHSYNGAFQGHCNSNEHNMVKKFQTGGRQASWLFTNVAEGSRGIEQGSTERSPWSQTESQNATVGSFFNLVWPHRLSLILSWQILRRGYF